MSAVVVVPLGISNAPRLRAWEATERHLLDRGYPIVTNNTHTEVDTWVKARAVREAIDRAVPAITDDTVLLIHDADVLVPAAALSAAVQAVADGNAAWAIPHRMVYRLSRRATERFYEVGHIADAPELDRHPYVGVAGGGVVVLTRGLYDQVPLDPRFAGWGDEDVAWGWALGALAGAPWRGTDHLVHLWHPHAAVQPHQRHNADPAAMALWRTYRAARDSPERMATLVRHAVTWAR